MEPDLSAQLIRRDKRETETEAARLVEFIEEALALVAVRSTADLDSLESIADRIERAARDLVVGLRELARERRSAQDDGGRIVG